MYETRVAQVAGSPVTVFVQKFRNYVLHYQFPAFAHRATWSDPPKVEMLLNRESLRAFEGWNAGAREYLESAQEQSDGRDPLLAYEAVVVEMYDWFFPAYDTAHAELLREYNLTIQTYNSVLSSAADLP